MANIERHKLEIEKTKEEIKKANPQGVHIRDLRRKLKRLLKEEKEFYYWQTEEELRKDMTKNEQRRI